MKITFVMPWYGATIPGGAEWNGRNTAEHLHGLGYEVEVLTTCIRDFYADWSTNFHQPGTEMVNGLLVHRFPVEPRDQAAFDAVNSLLMQNRQITPAQEQTYLNEMIRAPQLYDAMRERAAETIFVCMPYLFATTYFGAQIVPERTVLIPCLHDESYARLPALRQMMGAVAGLALQTDAELALVEKLCGAASGQRRVMLGCGVNTEFSTDGARFREKYDLHEPFLLYAGRPELGKNIPLLLSYFRRFRQAHGQPLKLVRIGPGQLVGAEDDPDILDLGFVPLQDKYDAFGAATAFCNPSLFESFSIVIMESWLARRPVLVHANCAPTREHCVKSNGGLYFGNYPEFAATLTYLLEHPAVARQMGENGRSYVLNNFAWPIVTRKYAALLEQVMAQVADEKVAMNG